MPRSRSSPTGIPSSSGVPLLQPPTRDTPSYNRSAYNNVPTAQQQHPEVAIVPHQGGGGGQVQVAPGAMVLRGGVAGGHGSSVTNGGFDQVRASFRLKLEWCGSRARAFYRKAGFSRVVSRLMPTCVSHPELIRVSLPNCLSMLRSCVMLSTPVPSTRAVCATNAKRCARAAGIRDAAAGEICRRVRCFVAPCTRQVGIDAAKW